MYCTCTIHTVLLHVHRDKSKTKETCFKQRLLTHLSRPCNSSLHLTGEYSPGPEQCLLQEDGLKGIAIVEGDPLMVLSITPFQQHLHQHTSKFRWWQSWPNLAMHYLRTCTFKCWLRQQLRVQRYNIENTKRSFGPSFWQQPSQILNGKRQLKRL